MDKITDRDKQVIIRLTDAGVKSKIIAHAFNIPVMAVAAYRAWATMKKNVETP